MIVFNYFIINLKIIRIFAVFFLTLPYNAYCAVGYSEKNGVYKLNGSITTDPQFYDSYWNIEPSLELTLNDDTSLVIDNFTPPSCTKNLKATINNLLAGGRLAATLLKTESKFNVFQVSCKATDKSGFWGITENYPPFDKSCSLSIPSSVDFGEISMGSSSGIMKTLSANVTCSSRKTSVALRLSGDNVSNGEIKIGDAKLSYVFNNDSDSYAFIAKKNVASSFKIHFTLKDTGTTAGKKQASVVLIANFF